MELQVECHAPITMKQSRTSYDTEKQILLQDQRMNMDPFCLGVLNPAILFNLCCPVRVLLMPLK